MADSLHVEVPPSLEVDVLGLESILESVPLTLLFISSKEWILSLWENRTYEIENITVWKKTIGRNDGFVLDVNCIDPASSTSFFAKMQRASVDTVLILHLLKKMKCGPDRFHITHLEGLYCDYHGVVTEGVEDWTMASSLTQVQKVDLLNEKHRLTTTTFLLTLLIELGHFRNIPRNRSNWGFINSVNESIPYPAMSLVDFSGGKYGQIAFNSALDFQTFWKKHLEYLFDKWQPVCGDVEDLQLFRDRTADLRKALLHGTVVEEQIPFFPFLQSRAALTDMLQSACDDTAFWLYETVFRAPPSLEEDDGYSGYGIISYSAYSLAYESVNPILSPFINVPRPETADVAGQYRAMVTEYMARVKEWNESLYVLFKWFPFPMKSEPCSGMKSDAADTSNTVVDTSNILSGALILHPADTF